MSFPMAPIRLSPFSSIFKEEIEQRGIEVRPTFEASHLAVLFLTPGTHLMNHPSMGTSDQQWGVAHRVSDDEFRISVQGVLYP